MSKTSPLSALTRPSGAFAMLAIDQRESMRAMFAEKQSGTVTDAQLVDFKLAALRALTPYASAVLIDHEFGWKPAIAAKAVAPTCGLIAAADRFIASADELVSNVVIDEEVDPATMKEDGAVALKLLVSWRPDEPAQTRIDMVNDFVARCRTAGLISIIEPVSKKARDGRIWDMNLGIAAAARELGGLGADLYKAEVPRHGKGGEKAVRDECAQLTTIIQGPWVVLSSGVAPDDFPRAVEWACKEGASGFLAGRAVWRNVIGSADVEKSLRDDAVVRLQRLCEVVDRVVAH
ncbi:aldolase [Variovorax sp. E3]|uniref:aldolase n=1 Tax=Variovorax sp. E3 TaxID=1914993 RepID=UPI0018DAFDA3|nr:aldolase [Variovorax sp. E3]